MEKLKELWSLDGWNAARDDHEETNPQENPQTPRNTSVPERYDIRKKFWTGLLEIAKRKTKLHANRSPGQYNWVSGKQPGTARIRTQLCGNRTHDPS